MKQPDINRITRATEHIQSAIASLKRIRPENRSMMEEQALGYHTDVLADEYRALRKVKNKIEEGKL